MEIVLLYKFYIFSFLNLKEGSREGEGGSKLCSKPEYSCFQGNGMHMKDANCAI